eukprot:TRINITY_DN375_c2_g1_i1.p1 TRINITY_DN375_c2_g1~~TRINITY_DN375_c2_g1_i1.p1  ORF type:complete len:534 (+),score=170.25 TRINITY_DN375_c2_g1_i1:95-1603(+)
MGPKARNIPKGKAGPAGELREAAREGDLRQVRALATAHMVDDVDERGFSALTWAAWNGHAECAAVLLERGAAPNVPDEDGQTPLFHACWYGHQRVVQMLIQSGADVDSLDNDKESCLSAAARGGHTRVVHMLIRANANPRTRDSEGHNAVSRALQRGHTHIAHLVEDYAKVYQPGQEASRAVQQLLAIAEQQDAAVGMAPAAPAMGMPALMPPVAASYGDHFGGDMYVAPGSPGSRTPAQAVAGLDGLQAQLQQKLMACGGGDMGAGAPLTGAYSQRMSFDSLTVLGPDSVRLSARGALPPIGTFVRLQGSAAYWRVLQLTKGGGMRLQSVACPNAAASWGDPGDELGPGVWAMVPGEQQQMIQRTLQEHLAEARRVQVQQEQQRQQVDFAARAHPAAQAQGASPRQGYAGAGGVAFGACGAKIASMPLAGLPPPGSPRRARYKQDHPCARAKNACTCCDAVRPPLNYCEECNEEMCGACWVREHQNKKRRSHVPHPVEVEE